VEGVAALAEALECAPSDVLATESPGPYALLCYESLGKPGVFCHRQIFAEWWREQTGEVVSELG